MPELEEVRQSTEEAISELINQFRRFPEKFLTEEDIRGYLYSLLLDKFDIEPYENTSDEEKSIIPHCEVRWNARGADWRPRSDIVLTDVSTLKTKEEGGYILPSKGYEFNKFYALIEIKFRRKQGVTDKSWRISICSDRSKIERIREYINGNEQRLEFYSYLLIFDKRKKIRLRLRNRGRDKERYVYPYQE